MSLVFYMCIVHPLLSPAIDNLIHTEGLLLLATATVKSIKRCHIVTELVVVWSVCSVCTIVTKSLFSLCCLFRNLLLLSCNLIGPSEVTK